MIVSNVPNLVAISFGEVQSDGRIRKWKKIKGEGKFLRVILLPDGETVHNVFFDRSFKGGTK